MRKTGENTKETGGRKRSRHIFRKIVIFLIVLVVLGGAALYAVVSLKQKYTVTYDGYTAAVGTISNSLSFSGTLQLVNSASYNASAASTVRNVYVQAGQEVREDDALLRLANGQTVKAEFDGRVNQVSVAENDKVSSGQEMIQVADFTHMKVQFRVDEYDINSVQVGDPCRITATATEKTFDSSLAAINYISASAGSVAYYTATAYVEVGEGVYPGMQVTVTIPQEEATDVVVLKMDAISFDETNRAFVYMQKEDGEMENVYVETGVSNGNYVEIKAGLQEGDQVYAVTETAAENAMVGLLSGLFGGQRFNGIQQNRRNFGTENTRNMDFQNMQMPGGGNGGTMPSMPSGGGAGFGGGGQ